MTVASVDADAIRTLRAIRAERPRAIREALRERARRPLVRDDGRLLIIAADHPARGALAVGSDSVALADRERMLERLVTALSRPGVDGVLGTPDVIDDLALLGALDDKLVIGSMNRGGLHGAVFEMDDRFTAFDVATMLRDGIDMAKVLVRINLQDRGTARTLESTAEAVTAASASDLPILLEPFLSRWDESRVVNDLSTDAVVRSVVIAQGLGASSAQTWLKLPVVADMERVLASTTLPVLLLGGDVGADLAEMFLGWEAALAHPGVRGLAVGRSLLHPPDGDVEGAVDAAVRFVHPHAVTHAVAPVTRRNLVFPDEGVRP